MAHLLISLFYYLPQGILFPSKFIKYGSLSFQSLGKLLLCDLQTYSFSQLLKLRLIVYSCCLYNLSDDITHISHISLPH